MSTTTTTPVQDSYAPQPKHWIVAANGDYMTPNVMWNDGSKFQFDLPPRFVLGEEGSSGLAQVSMNWHEGGVYDIPRLQRIPLTHSYCGWTNWVDKMQKDYRFGAMSDENARANLFPEVQDPWMFTEYVYQGKGQVNDLDGAAKVASTAIQPPLFHPIRATRTMGEDEEGNPTISTSAPNEVNNQLPTVVPYETQVSYTTDDQWLSAATGNKYWTSELAAAAWQEDDGKGGINRAFTRYPSATAPNQRQVIRFNAPKINSGVKLYREQVWSAATRFGHSQNIPDRTISLTAPKEFIRPDSLFTGKMVPTITIAWGIPIYDVCSEDEPQKVIKYDYYAVGYGSKNTRIGMKQVTPAGPDGKPEGQFTYALSPSDVGTMDQCELPTDYIQQVELGSPEFLTDDLVHRGCQFWVGHSNGSSGVAACSYYTQYTSQFQSLWDLSTEYTDVSVDIANPVSVQPFLSSQYQIQAWVTNGTAAEVRLDGTGGLGFTIKNVGSAGSAISSVSIVNTNSPNDPVYPCKPLSQGGIFATPAGTVTIRLSLYNKNRPYPSGKLCGIYQDKDGKLPTSNADAKEGYQIAGGLCPYYTPLGQRVVASYQQAAANGAEWANMQAGLPADYKQSPAETMAGQGAMSTFGDGVGMGLGARMSLQEAYLPTPDPYTAGTTSTAYQRIELTFTPEMVSVAGKSTYMTNPNPPTNEDASQFIRVHPDGNHIIDYFNEASYGGVDTVFFGMVNQINYRIMRAVQHCYTPDKCNPIITDPTGSVPWIRGRFSNINFIGSDLCPPGYPALDGTDRYCHWGNSRCPYTNLDRRACEYDANYQVLLAEILYPFRINGIASFAARGLKEAFVSLNGSVVFLTEDEFNQSSDNQKLICVAVSTAVTQPPVIGHWQPTVKDGAGTSYRIFFYYDRPSWDPHHVDQSNVMAHIVQFDDTNSPCYINVADFNDNTGTNPDTAAMTTMFGDPTKIPWLVSLDGSYQQPVGNAVWATNGHAFSGGRHPEYKDQSKRGRAIMCDSGGYTDLSYESGITPTNQFGGPTWNVANVSGSEKKAYWTEHDGIWILDGFPIPDPGGYVPVAPRLVNKPDIISGCYPVDGVPGTGAETTPHAQATGSNQQDSSVSNPTSTPIWASVGATYSNDTKLYLQYLDTIWEDQLPIIPGTDPPEKVHIAPPQSDPAMLPRERFWYRCDCCGIDYSEEEMNYWVSLLDGNGNRLYPVVNTSSGSTANSSSGINSSGGSVYVSNSTYGAISQLPLTNLQYGDDHTQDGGWLTNPAILGCPRGDGGNVRLVGHYDRFMNCYSRGYADVWGPPGTTVRHDAFFYKQPTMVNRVHQDSIERKLGPYSTDQYGGGYQFQTLTPEVDLVGRLPVTTARGYQPGLARQIVAPWGAPGESVTTVRKRVAAEFEMLPTDSSTVIRPGQQMFAVANEDTFNLQSGDVLTFWRFDLTDNNRPYLVGVPIGIMTAPDSSILNDPLVIADANTPRPQRTDFPANTTGDRMYQNELRLWLLDVVTNSLPQYSSSFYMQVNLLSQSLKARGFTGDAGQSMDPTTGDDIDVDERVVAPYGLQGGGLKMVTLKNLKGLRNRIIPMTGYSLTNETYTAGGDFTNEVQTAFDLRFSTTEKLPVLAEWMPVYGTIPAQILAASSTGMDYYTEWDLGDVDGTKARAYYPNGTTWWRMNQTIGQINRNGGTNPLHLDDYYGTYVGMLKTGQSDYTGDIICSTVTFFLHGRVPMHMELVRAVLIYSAGDPPDMSAIGCQGQYTGVEGINDFNGNFIPIQYVGNAYCFWQHYHGFTTNHEKDIGSFAGGEIGGDVTGYHGAASKRHADGHPYPPLQVNDPTLPIYMMEMDSVTVMPQNWDTSYLWNYDAWQDGDTTDDYTSRINSVMGDTYVDSQFGFNVAQGFIKPWSWGQILEFSTNEYGTWKDITYAQWNLLLDRYTVPFKAAVNTVSAVQTGTYFGSMLRGTLYARENQPIPGWLNMDGIDTSGRFSTILQYEPQVTDAELAAGAAVPQDDSGVVIHEPGGGNGPEQGGAIPKLLDVTDMMKKLYNDRVDRFFKLTLGKKFSDLYAYVISQTDTNLGQHAAFHTGNDDPQYFQNYRYVKSPYGIWLNDPWHHTPLSNDEPVGPDGSGDPIEQSTDDQAAVVIDTTGWDKQGISNTSSPSYMQYHPLSLLNTSPAVFNSSSPSTLKPVPQQNLSLYWRVRADQSSGYEASFDLRQMPYETSRQPWRDQPPSIDSSDALCPNPSCLVHQNHWTVAQLYEEATNGIIGGFPVPSTASDICAECGTKMTAADGVQYIAGDGILTVFYQNPLFVDDKLIVGMEIDVTHPLWNPTVNHGFIVEFFNSAIGRWRDLLTVTWDQTTRQFTFLQWTNNGWAATSVPSLPPVFKGVEGAKGVPNDTTGSLGAHFIAVPGAKVRIRVPEPAPVNMQEPPGAATTFAACTVNVTAGTVTIAGLNDPATEYAGRTLAMLTPAGATAMAAAAAANQTLPAAPTFDVNEATDNGDGTYTFTIDGTIDPAMNQYQFTWKEYIVRVTKFNVYGFPYTAEDLVITPPAANQMNPLQDGITTMKLDAWPSQIYDVDILVGDSIPITTTMSTDPTSNDSFNWTVAKYTYDGNTYLRITGCNWAYDYNLNQITLPTVYKDPATNVYLPIWNLNADLYASQTANFTLKTLPCTIYIEYLQGCGVPIEVDCTAIGPGPSYQLEPDCVCFIVGDPTQSPNLPQTITTYDVLPTMGQSVPLKNRQGLPIDMQWQVYNHKPLVWGGGMGWLVGDELGAGNWGDSSVMDVYTGNQGFNVADLGPNATIGGTVTGQVTLYGLPNTILSGSVYVYAKAETSRTYNFADGTSTTLQERTGGYRSGAFVFRLEVDGPVSNKRTGLTAGIPTVLLYMRERDLSETLDTD